MFSKLVFLITIGASFNSAACSVVVLGTPVLFTNNDGGGTDEIQVPNGSQTNRVYCTSSTSGTLTNAWYTPYDNINDLTAIAHVDMTPYNPYCALLTVGGYASPRDARVRIRIYADIS